MTNIGHDVTIPIIIKVNGTLTDPATVAVAVTSPTGTVTNPTATRLSLGTYEAVVPATQAGRWRYKVTTDSPDSVQWGHFDVTADPPPPGRLMPLATIGDLLARVDSLTDAQQARAPALLTDASGKIRGYTKQTFDLTLNDTIVLRPVGSHLRLPQRPVIAVDQVVALGGSAAIPDITLPAGSWTFDGVDLVDVCPPDAGWILNLPATWVDGYGPDTYRVTYDHGYPVTPDDVVAVCCAMVLRVLESPTTVEGLVQERIGQYSYQFGQFPGGQSPGLTVRMSDADRDDLKHYRRTQSSTAVRVR